MNRDFVDYALARLDAKAADITRQTGEGAAGDWANYQRRVGRVEGLHDAMAELRDIARHWQDEQDE